MRTDSVKKYVIPNIPYLFILWACLNSVYKSYAKMSSQMTMHLT